MAASLFLLISFLPFAHATKSPWRFSLCPSEVLRQASVEAHGEVVGINPSDAAVLSQNGIIAQLKVERVTEISREWDAIQFLPQIRPASGEFSDWQTLSRRLRQLASTEPVGESVSPLQKVLLISSEHSQETFLSSLRRHAESEYIPPLRSPSIKGCLGVALQMATAFALAGGGMFIAADSGDSTWGIVGCGLGAIILNRLSSPSEATVQSQIDARLQWSQFFSEAESMLWRVQARANGKKPVWGNLERIFSVPDSESLPAETWRLRIVVYPGGHSMAHTRTLVFIEGPPPN